MTMGQIVNITDFKRPNTQPLPLATQEPESSDDCHDWRAGMSFVKYTDHMRHAAFFRLRIMADKFGKGSQQAKDEANARQRADDDHFMACSHLMQIPAPTVGALRWKEDHRNYDGGRRGWELAIARDKRRLASKLAVITRRKARKAVRS